MIPTSDLSRRVRDDFPILATEMSGRPLVFLDNAATTQKPRVVIDAIANYYTRDNANIHRGLYELSQRATDGYEDARKKVADFLGVGDDPACCLFVRGTTEAINLVASCHAKPNLSSGDVVLLTGLEHHSNIVPWQMACDRTGATLRVWQPDGRGELDMSKLSEMVTPEVKMVAVQHVSNALGTIHDVETITAAAKDVDATVLIDGAQWVGHYPTDLKRLGCDFYVFSGHKLYGPTGIGVLWGRRDLLDAMPPYQGGGDMIETVSFAATTYAPLPNKFEAGTPHIAGAIGLGAAVDYLTGVGMTNVGTAEDALLAHATKRFADVPELRIVGTADRKAAIISFVIDDPPIATLDIAQHLSYDGIAVRTGHHCCMPLMDHLNVSGTARASMAFYNTTDDIDRLVDSLQTLVDKRRAKREQAKAPEIDAADITFAPAAYASIDEAAEDLAEEFTMFDDAESKTELLVEFGDELPDAFTPLKAISTAVPGCMSEVYVIGRPVSDGGDRFEFAGDSNAQIVRGLIAVVLKLFSGQPRQEIETYDVEGFFRRIGLDQFVTSQRRNGLDGMIRRIRTLASGQTGAG